MSFLKKPSGCEGEVHVSQIENIKDGEQECRRTTKNSRN